jgi:hypothetical protein
MKAYEKKEEDLSEQAQDEMDYLEPEIYQTLRQFKKQEQIELEESLKPIEP